MTDSDVKRWRCLFIEPLGLIRLAGWTGGWTRLLKPANLTFWQAPAETRSGSWVELVEHRAQPFPGHVGVDLGRRNVRMAKHRLQGAQVGAVLEQVGGEGMPACGS